MQIKYIDEEENFEEVAYPIIKEIIAPDDKVDDLVEEIRKNRVAILTREAECDKLRNTIAEQRLEIEKLESIILNKDRQMRLENESIDKSVAYYTGTIKMLKDQIRTYQEKEEIARVEAACASSNISQENRIINVKCTEIYDNKGTEQDNTLLITEQTNSEVVDTVELEIEKQHIISTNVVSTPDNISGSQYDKLDLNTEDIFNRFKNGESRTSICKLYARDNKTIDGRILKGATEHFKSINKQVSKDRLKDMLKLGYIKFIATI